MPPPPRGGDSSQLANASLSAWSIARFWMRRGLQIFALLMGQIFFYMWHSGPGARACARSMPRIYLSAGAGSGIDM